METLFILLLLLLLLDDHYYFIIVVLSPSPSTTTTAPRQIPFAMGNIITVMSRQQQRCDNKDADKDT